MMDLELDLTVNDLGLLCEQSGFPEPDIITRMNEKVNFASEILETTYASFDKGITLSQPFYYETTMQLICDVSPIPDAYVPFWYHPDHLGSSSYITNLGGEINQHMEYLPFGELLVEEHLNSYNSPFKFNAKEFDAETGNYYYGARYYSPKYNLMFSVDQMYDLYPSFSPYAYTLQNPVRYVDPTGMTAEDYDDIIIRGRNGNEITIPTADDNHRYVNIPFDIDESRTMDLGLGDVNTNNVAVGYSIGASAEASAVYGGEISGNITVVNFPSNSEYSDYNYVYAGGEITGSGGMQKSASANVEANFFVAYSRDRENIKPSYFEGRASTYGLKFDAKAVAGGGFSVYGFQSQDKSWTGVGVGFNLGTGGGLTIGAWTRGESNLTMLSNQIPTQNRSSLDRFINSSGGIPMVSQAVYQYIRK
jgi:RHS repeat-associated protein